MKKILLLLTLPTLSYSQITFNDIISINSLNNFKRVMIENGFEKSNQDINDMIWYGYNLNKKDGEDLSRLWCGYDKDYGIFQFKFSLNPDDEKKNFYYKDGYKIYVEDNVYDITVEKIKKDCEYQGIKSVNEDDYVCYTCSQSSNKVTIGFTKINGTGIIRNFNIIEKKRINISDINITIKEGDMFWERLGKPYKWDGSYRLWYENGQLKGERSYKYGKWNGLYKLWYEDGQLKEEGNYSSGELDGLCKKWYENGQLNYEVNYKNGQKDGLYKWWYENGQLMNEGNYKNGRDGLWREWYENGQLKKEVNWKDGEYDGLYIWWYENGYLMGKNNYKNGVKNGLCRRWYENGQLEYEKNYKNGVLIEEKNY